MILFLFEIVFFYLHYGEVNNERFEDTKDVIWRRKSKKNRQYIGQKNEDMQINIVFTYNTYL
jgi:hypothetical protein